jgi:phosphatidate phosphatase APP1
LKFVKTAEVLFFKVLEFLDFYRSQKSIIGIPSLATRASTMLQAVVYNGTQEEVLGFRPRRLLHRILKGVPDLEYFESVGFQLSVSANASRSVSASTQARGFIQLQLPWHLPYRLPKVAWLRMLPRGVETIFGRVRLGDYEIVSSPVFFLTEEIRWILVSDIDDTIKDSKIHQSTHWRKVVRGIFRGHYYHYDAIQGMRELYQDLVARNVMIVYLTSTPYQLAPFLLKFLRDAGFPDGPVFPRWLGYGRFGHKWRTIHRLFSNIEDRRCLLVGDSGEQDLQIYRRACEIPQFASRIGRIFIRHVPGTPVPTVLSKREIVYQEISELRDAIYEVLG